MEVEPCRYCKCTPIKFIAHYRESNNVSYMCMNKDCMEKRAKAWADAVDLAAIAEWNKKNKT